MARCKPIPGTAGKRRHQSFLALIKKGSDPYADNEIRWNDPFDRSNKRSID